MTAPGEVILNDFKWKIYRQDSGMGEHDYALFKYDVFYCRAESHEDILDILRALRYYEGAGK